MNSKESFASPLIERSHKANTDSENNFSFEGSNPEVEKEKEKIAEELVQLNNFESDASPINVHNVNFFYGFNSSIYSSGYPKKMNCPTFNSPTGPYKSSYQYGFSLSPLATPYAAHLDEYGSNMNNMKIVGFNNSFSISQNNNNKALNQGNGLQLENGDAFVNQINKRPSYTNSYLNNLNLIGANSNLAYVKKLEFKDNLRDSKIISSDANFDITLHDCRTKIKHELNDEFINIVFTLKKQFECSNLIKQENLNIRRKSKSGRSRSTVAARPKSYVIVISKINMLESIMKEQSTSDFSDPEFTPLKKSNKVQDEEGATETYQKCKCKKSKCLKLYCECFAAGDYCANCDCVSCNNTEDHEPMRTMIMNTVQSKSNSAFKPKITEENQHLKGCRCQKSGCQKKYCECFQNGIQCSSNCKCISCKNIACIKTEERDNYEDNEYTSLSKFKYNPNLTTMDKPSTEYALSSKGKASQSELNCYGSAFRLMSNKEIKMSTPDTALGKQRGLLRSETPEPRRFTTNLLESEDKFSTFQNSISNKKIRSKKVKNDKSIIKSLPLKENDASF